MKVQAPLRVNKAGKREGRERERERESWLYDVNNAKGRVSSGNFIKVQVPLQGKEKKNQGKRELVMKRSFGETRWIVNCARSNYLIASKRREGGTVTRTSGKRGVSRVERDLL